MKKNMLVLFVEMALAATPLFAQSIDVTTEGVNVSAPLAVDGDVSVAGNLTTTGSATVGSLVVGASTILNEGYFESAPQQFPGSNATLTLPHGMAGKPRFTTVSLVCISPEFGWAAGDEILLSSIHMRSDNHGVTVGVNDTHFKLRQLGNVHVHRLDASGIAYVSSSGNWGLVFRAWR